MSSEAKIKNKKTIKKKIIIGSIIVGLIIVGGTMMLIDNNGVSEEIDIAPELYSVPGREKIFVNGKVIPVQSKDLSIDGDMGELDKINVDNGIKVEKGTSLFTCKNESIISELNDRKEELSKKEKEKQNIIDEAIKTELEAEIDEIKSDISRLESKAYITINAPFAGKVYINDDYMSGESQTSNIMTVETEEFYIKGQVSEQDLSKISLEQDVDIVVISTKEKLKGKVSYIGERPSLSEGGDMVGNQSMSYYDIKISINEGQDLSKVKNGFHVQTTIEITNKNIKLPKTSLKQEDGKTYVFKIIDEIIYKQEVKLGETTDEYAVIEEGVLEEDKVIKYADDENIKDGERIYIKENDFTEGEDESLE